MHRSWHQRFAPLRVGNFFTNLLPGPVPAEGADAEPIVNSGGPSGSAGAAPNGDAGDCVFAEFELPNVNGPLAVPGADGSPGLAAAGDAG